MLARGSRMKIFVRLSRDHKYFSPLEYGISLRLGASKRHSCSKGNGGWSSGHPYWMVWIEFEFFGAPASFIMAVGEGAQYLTRHKDGGIY
jgi:hypothetical protein